MESYFVQIKSCLKLFIVYNPWAWLQSFLVEVCLKPFDEEIASLGSYFSNPRFFEKLIDVYSDNKQKVSDMCLGSCSSKFHNLISAHMSKSFCFLSEGTKKEGKRVKRFSGPLLSISQHALKKKAMQIGKENTSSLITSQLFNTTSFKYSVIFNVLVLTKNKMVTVTPYFSTS